MNIAKLHLSDSVRGKEASNPTDATMMESSAMARDNTINSNNKKKPSINSDATRKREVGEDDGYLAKNPGEQSIVLVK